MQKLIIEDDEGKQVVVPLIRDEITIGRQEGNTIRLTDQNVSRRHARLIRDNGAMFIEDLGSYCGVKVNGSKITARVALRDGDAILLGDYKLGLKSEAPSKTASYNDGGAAPRGSSPAATVQGHAPAFAAQTAPIAAPPPLPAAPAPEPIEGAPTIPLRTLENQGLVPGPAPALPPGRLVAISTPLAGSEFLLDRPSLVIGRTPENDIILNHKSISRHHAKIIRDGDRYFVLDLESANGVRVNGAEQERVELASGDVIELGHVRLRFVSGDDPYAGQMGASLLGLGGSGSSRKLIIAAAAGVLVVGGAIAALSMGGSKSDKPPVAAAGAASPAPTAPTSASGGNATALARLETARAALRDGKWDEAIFAANEASAADATSTEASTLRTQAEAERTAATHLRGLKRELEAGNLPAASAMLAQIADGTRGRLEAQSLVDRARVGYVSDHLLNAERQRAKGACTEVRREVDLIFAVDAQNERAKEIAAACKEPAAKPTTVAIAKPDPTPEPPKAPPAPKPVAAPRPTPAVAAKPVAAAPVQRPTSPVEEAAPAGDPDELLQQAQDAWLKGQYAVAIDHSRKALRIRPGLGRAYQIIAVCSCSLRDHENATKAYDRLDEKNKKLVKTLCQKSGVALD